MSFQISAGADRIRRVVAAIVACGIAVAGNTMAAGSWTALDNPAPASIEMLLLLPDGTVMAKEAEISSNWYRLTPDVQGSYVHGTWTTLAPMHNTRLFFSSQVLRDGRVFVAGGEYGTGGATSEVYDPITGIWTSIPVPTSLLNPSQRSPVAPTLNQGFLDSVSEILPDGNVLVAPVFPKTSGGTLIFNAASNTWSAGPTLLGFVDQDEASWVKLRDGSILTVDPFGTNAERYIASSNQWILDASLPVELYDTNGEMGAAFLLPDGRTFFPGGTGHTAIYTPSGTTSPGTWIAGPDFPGGQATPDAPAAMLVNGRLLFCTCAIGPGSTPTSFFEYDAVSNSFESVGGPGPVTNSIPPFACVMLDLPDGNVLFATHDNQLYVYKPSGVPLAAGKPGVIGIARNADGSYHLTGTQLNGISEGAAFGDDAQMNSNYPLVRITNSADDVYYARTFDWSSTGVMTGNATVTTEFALPGNLPAGTYSLVVTANGISSDPVSFTTPIALQIGQPDNPFVVSWPASVTNSVLQMKASLLDGAWTDVTNGVAVIGSSLVMTNSPDLRAAFFRLRID